MPSLVAAVAFFVYWPSLSSDFVYDARIEIFQEGFITSISNLPAVLSLKVLGMNLMLGDRPGQLLYLMLHAAIWGKEPWGYHLSSNLLHATNAALLFILLRRLVSIELAGVTRNQALKIQIALVAVTLIFALHPIVVEAVSAINYSSDLLVTFFALLALLAATAFRPNSFRTAILTGSAGVFCAFAAVTCKESGIATPLLLIVYWFLFRREEPKIPWLLFLGTAITVTAAFLTARFLYAPASPEHTPYLGGSFSQVFLVQPRLWVFMMGKLVWPTQLSADYTMENLGGLSTLAALVVLSIVVGLQMWISCKSRIGALGVAMFWLGLATVSNFTPLFRILGDRFYYLPLAGLAMQLFALLLMTLRTRSGFWMAATPALVVILPLTLLTLTREEVFANELSLWKDTLQVSPFSWTAHSLLGAALAERGELDEAIVQYQKAVEIAPKNAVVRGNLGNTLLRRGLVDEAMAEYGRTLEINPKYADVHYNLGNALVQKGRESDAIAEFQKALEINPLLAPAHNNLGIALFHQGRVDEAMAEYQRAFEIDPSFAEAHYDLGNALLKSGRIDDAIGQYQKTLEIKPGIAEAYCNLGTAFLQKGDVDAAIVQYQKALEIDPNNTEAQTDLARANSQKSGGNSR